MGIKYEPLSDPPPSLKYVSGAPGLFTFFGGDDITLKRYVFAFIQNLQHPVTLGVMPVLSWVLVIRLTQHIVFL